ncbi:MAG TPA: hypothetical protein VE175_12415, partial [Woeseiaceae bacterium]|nr:hypothetical protein [Woeseiaceae bacterium]
MRYALPPIACAVALMLGGCAAGPDYRAPSVDTGGGWAEPSAASEPIENASRWWTTFDDPTLDRLVEQARANNRGLREAVARVEQAR